MRIQLDTDKKTIKIEEDVLLEKLIETLERFLPKGEWKKFTLEVNAKIYQWNEPIIIRQYPYTPWWESPWICSNGKSDTKEVSYNLNSGVYNIEA